MKIGSKLRTIVIKNPYVPKVHGERKDKDIHHYKLVGKTSYLLLAVTEKRVRETFNYADVIAPAGRKLQIRENGEWRDVTKEDFNQ